MPHDRGDLPGRRGGHLRAAAAQRLRQRVPDLPRGVRLAGRPPRIRRRGPAGDRRDPGARADRRPGGGLLRQGLRRRLPGRAAQRRRPRARTRRPLAMRLPMVVAGRRAASAIGLLGAARCSARWRRRVGRDRWPRRRSRGVGRSRARRALWHRGGRALRPAAGAGRVAGRCCAGGCSRGRDGRRGRHLGLRLRRADRPHAVHGLVLRRSRCSPPSGCSCDPRPACARPRASSRTAPPCTRRSTTPSNTACSRRSSGGFATWRPACAGCRPGRSQLYVLYIAVAMLALLVWKLGVGR